MEALQRIHQPGRIKMKLICMYMALILTIASCADPLDPSKSKIDVSISVINENGQMIPDVKLSIFFTHTESQRRKLGMRTHKIEEIFDGENKTRVRYEGFPSIGISAQKEGFWDSQTGHTFLETDRIDNRDGKPNPQYQKDLIIMLRRKENPRPLFVNRIALDSPGEFSIIRGFDLEIGDMVVPYGTGEIPDLIFTIHQEKGEKEGVYESHFEVTFSNLDDGVIVVEKVGGGVSQLLLGSIAPEEGYAPMPKIRKGVADRRGWLTYTATPTKEELEKIEGYWLRVRSNRDPETGELIARYGKIGGDIYFYTDETKWVFAFTYFLAPDHSRFVEWNGESLIPGANLQGVNKR